MNNDVKKKKPGNSTAIISILTRDHIQHEAFKKSPVQYNISLSFGGNTLLPPFLPRMRSEGMLEVRRSIISEMEKLRELTPNLNNPEGPGESGAIILRKIEEIGRRVANFLPEFKEVLKALPDLEVSNVIIYTNDFAIPWLWSFYQENPRQSKQEDFLMNRYPCGLLIVDADESGAMNRINRFRSSYEEQRKTDALLLKELDVSFFVGSLGEVNSIYQKNALFLDYNQIFRKRFEEDVHLIADLSPKGSLVQNKRLLKSFGSHIDCAKIIHYTGAMSHQQITFDESYALTKEDIDHLSNFDYQPLLVMHGCITESYTDLEKIDRPLPTVFLEKGASGCLMATLPTTEPLARVHDSPNSLLRLFYSHLMEMKPYGQALFDAIRDFRAKPENKDNPTWLFYKFYGDPRCKLLNSDGNAWLERINSAEKVKELKFRKRQRQFESAEEEEAPVPIKKQPVRKKPDEIKVFISYAREDAEHVRTIYAQMEQQGLTPWMDEFDLQPGARWRKEVSRNIIAADYVLIVLSTHSVAHNGNIKSEIAQAQSIAEKLSDTEYKIIPMVLDDTEIPLELEMYNGFYLKDKPIDFLIKSLIKAKEREKV